LAGSSPSGNALTRYGDTNDTKMRAHSVLECVGRNPSPSETPVTVEILLLDAGDETVLSDVAPEVFDGPVQSRLAAEFVADPRHHLAVARASGLIVGFASAVHYVHPDKPPELWVNEVGVAPTYQRQGLAKQLLRAVFDAGRSVGCQQAWVLTERSNTSAMRLYDALGGVEASGQPVMFEFPLDAAVEGG
jgi:ribosomal protein S18 acetylase RimI-like enzyme